jgi:CRP-like cAMP-binding protein
MSKATLRTLGTLELFCGYRRHTLAKIDRLGYTLDVEPGRILCEQGAPGAEFFVLVTGLVEVHSEAGAVALLREGAWFGETALLNGGYRRATVIARTRARVLVFSKREFDELMRLVPGIRSRLQATCTRVIAGNAPTAQPWYQRLPRGFQSMVATQPGPVTS